MTDQSKIIEMLAKLYPGQRVIEIDGWRGNLRLWHRLLRWALWDTKARLIHPLGFHTMLPLEQWDAEAGSTQFDGLACWLCEKRI